MDFLILKVEHCKGSKNIVQCLERKVADTVIGIKRVWGNGIASAILLSLQERSRGWLLYYWWGAKWADAVARATAFVGREKVNVSDLSTP